jgi:hypothetical protein
MNKEKILEDIQSLIQDIDKCNRKFRRSSSNGNTEAFVKSLYEIERILPAVHQELSFLYDQINTLYGLKEKADELYFRAFTLSADIHSTEAFKEAMDDYWHYVNYELKEKGGSNED